MRVGLVAIPVSLWASWAAWRGPPPEEATATPPPIPRMVDASARTEQRRVARALTERIQAAMVNGPVTLSALRTEDGTVLDTPIPDNPLVPGIAHVIAHCGDSPSGIEADWWYCEESGVLRPGLAQ